MEENNNNAILFKMEHSVSAPKAIIIGVAGGVTAALVNMAVEKTIVKVHDKISQRKGNKNKKK